MQICKHYEKNRIFIYSKIKLLKILKNRMKGQEQKGLTPHVDTFSTLLTTRLNILEIQKCTK